MITKTFDIDFELFGAEFANMDSEKQALFFRGLARELVSWKSNYRMQIQFAYIAKALVEKDKNTLQDVLPMLWEKDPL